MLRELALFAGCGGGLLGSKLLGWSTRCAVEFNPFRRDILLQRQADGFFEPFPIWDDVQTFGVEQLRWCLSAQQEAEDMAGKLQKLTEQQIDTAIVDYDRGLSLADLAHLLGVTRQNLWAVFKVRGVLMRPQSRFSTENHFYRHGKRADINAQKRVSKAIQRGRLINPGRCETCGMSKTFKDGRSGIQAHHDDYNRPLEVRWLCQPCHHEWHKNNHPIPKKGGVEPVAIDVISGGFP